MLESIHGQSIESTHILHCRGNSTVVETEACRVPGPQWCSPLLKLNLLQMLPTMMATKSRTSRRSCLILMANLPRNAPGVMHLKDQTRELKCEKRSAS